MIRFAYGCLPSLMSLYFANYLVRRSGRVPSCIVLSTGGLRFKRKKYTTVQAIPVLTRHLGLRFTGYLALAGLGGAVLPRLRRRASADRLLSFDELARVHGFPIIESDDFSAADTLARIEPLGLDLFVTCMCDQILRDPLLSRPIYGCVNIHASRLPEFRGVDSVFQAMLHDSPEIGATIHRTTARVDCGDSYGQVAFPRRSSDSHLLLLAKAAAAGVGLLDRHLDALERGAALSGVALDPAAARYPYRSWPEREELAEFRRKGLVLWRASDLRRVLRFADVLDGERERLAS